MYYRNLITTLLAEIGRSEVSPIHVEGWMRAEHTTLDALDRTTFKAEVVFAVGCIDGPDGHLSDQLAKSYGL